MVVVVVVVVVVIVVVVGFDVLRGRAQGREGGRWPSKLKQGWLVNSRRFVRYGRFDSLCECGE